MADNSHNDYGNNPIGRYGVIAVLVIVFILFLLFAWPVSVGILQSTG